MNATMHFCNAMCPNFANSGIEQLRADLAACQRELLVMTNLRDAEHDAYLRQKERAEQAERDAYTAPAQPLAPIPLRGCPQCGYKTHIADEDDEFDFILNDNAEKAIEIDDLTEQLESTEALLARYREALEFYADPERYYGPNRPLNGHDKWSEQVGLTAYRLDVTRDQGEIAKQALAIPTQQAALNEAMNNEKLNPWKCVLIGLNVTYWSYKKEHDNDPRAALNDLLAANAYYAADPQVSEVAAKHVNEAIARELESMANMITWDWRGDILHRAAEIRGK